MFCHTQSRANAVSNCKIGKELPEGEYFKLTGDLPLFFS